MDVENIPSSKSILSSKDKIRIREHAMTFCSVPMTLEELGRRTGESKETLLYEFREVLHTIDQEYFKTVNNILSWLDNNMQRQAS